MGSWNQLGQSKMEDEELFLQIVINRCQGELDEFIGSEITGEQGNCLVLLSDFCRYNNIYPRWAGGVGGTPIITKGYHGNNPWLPISHPLPWANFHTRQSLTTGLRSRLVFLLFLSDQYT
jgi:hypothetical protein